jgi:hypothetical protein
VNTDVIHKGNECDTDVESYFSSSISFLFFLFFLSFSFPFEAYQ